MHLPDFFKTLGEHPAQLFLKGRNALVLDSIHQFQRYLSNFWSSEDNRGRTYIAILLLTALWFYPDIRNFVYDRMIVGAADKVVVASEGEWQYQHTSRTFKVWFGKKDTNTAAWKYEAEPAKVNPLKVSEKIGVGQWLTERYFGKPTYQATMVLESLGYRDTTEGQLLKLLVPRLEKIQASAKNQVPNSKKDYQQSWDALMKQSDAPQLTIDPTATEAQQDQVLFINGSKDFGVLYTVLPNQGVKEEIIIYQTPSMDKECMQKALNAKSASVFTQCPLPYNQYTFSMQADAGVQLLRTAEGVWYLADKQGRYLGHFANLVATDGKGAKTNNLALTLEPSTEKDQARLTITMDLAWMMDPARTYPIQIDPSVIYDETAEFATGTFDRSRDSGSGASPRVESYYQELPNDASTVGLYHMNNSWNDSSGMGNNGTASGTTFTTSGRIGSHAGSFNGTSNYVSVADNNSLSPAIITVEAWIYQTANSSYREAAAQYPGTFPTNTSWLLRTSQGGDGRFTPHIVDVSVNGYACSGDYIPLNTWSHIALTYDGDTLRGYQNGVLTCYTASPSGALNNSSGSIMIGASGTTGSPTEYFSGYIDELRISARVLSESELKASAARRPVAVYTSPAIDLGSLSSSINSLAWTENGVMTGDGETPFSTTGLVAQWNFNSTSGTTATADAGSCGATCNGTLTNFASTGSQDAAARTGWTATNKRWGAGALMFDGVDDYVTVSPTILNGASAATVETWIKLDRYASTGQTPIIVDRTATQNDFQMLVYPNDNAPNKFGFSLWTSGGSTTCNTYENMPLGEWTLVAAVYNGTTLSCYINGRQSGTTPAITGTITANSNDLRFGGDAFGNRLAGELDAFRIYSRALTEAELLSHFNSGNIQFQTRTGTDATPDDGGWNNWLPTNGETQILSTDSDASSWQGQSGYTPNMNLSVNQTNYTAPSGPTGCTANRPVLVNNFGNTSTLTNYPVRLQIPYLAGMNASFTDLRFTTENGTHLYYWLDTYTSSTTATVWVKVDTITANTTKRIVLWYGSCTGGNTSSETNTFGAVYPFYDLGNIPTSQGMNGWYMQSYNGSSYTNLAYNSSGATYWWDPVADASATTPYIRTSLTGTSTLWASLRWQTSSLLRTRVIGGLTLNTTVACNGKNAVFTLDGTTLKSLSVGSNSSQSLNFDYIYDLTSGQGYYLRATTSGPDIYCFGNDPMSFRVQTWTYTYPVPTASVETYYPLPRLEGTNSLQISQGAARVDGDVVAAFHFEETGGSGSYIKDSSGVGNHAAVTGSPSLRKGIFGNARRFAAGTSDRLAVSTFNGFPAGNPLTYELWFKPQVVDGTQNIILDRDLNLRLEIAANNTLAAYIGNGSSWCSGISAASNTAVTSDRWYYVAVTWDNSTMRMYVNGDLQTTTTSGTCAVALTQLNIGNYASPGTYDFTGIIDELRISKVARSPEEIMEIYRLGRYHQIATSIGSTDLTTSSLLSFNVAADRPGTTLAIIPAESAFSNNQADANTRALWHLDEETNTTSNMGLRDNSPNNISGQLGAGTAANIPTTTQALFGKGRQFDGTNDLISLGTNTNLMFNTGTTVTFSGWIYLPSSDGYDTIIGRPVPCANSGNYMIDLSGQTLRFSYINSGQTTGHTATVGTIPLNRWFHFAIVYTFGTGSSFRGYLNGILTNSGTWTAGTGNEAPYTNAAHTTEIGHFAGAACTTATYYFQGVIDELRVDTVARTAQEIRQAYEIKQRTHTVTVDFGARLDAGNLITGSGDTSFTIDATTYGASSKGSNLYPGDTLIVKENYNGTEYRAQGIVATVTASTGAVTVANWDANSTFPSGGQTGFGANADVFKWQKEFMDLSGMVIGSGSGDTQNQRNAVTVLSAVATGTDGANIFIDDIRSVSSYLTTPSGSVVTSPTQRYVQTRGILTTSNSLVSPWLSQQQLNYTTGPSNDLILRHGKWFGSGQKQSFWWSQQ